jgi:hypothetical protein
MIGAEANVYDGDCPQINVTKIWSQLLRAKLAHFPAKLLVRRATGISSVS